MSHSTGSELDAKSPVTDESYEAPQLTPIGNLRDLLATGTGSQCDEIGDPGTGTDPDICN